MFTDKVKEVQAAPMGYLRFEDVAEAFGELHLDGNMARWVVFNAIDFYRLRQVLDRNSKFDGETQIGLIQGGVVGYLMGATVVLEDIPRGALYVSSVDNRCDVLRDVSRMRKVTFKNV